MANDDGAGGRKKPPDGDKESKTSAVVEELKDHGKLIGGTVGVLWIINAINWMVGYRLDQFGILPRTLVGLRGILFAPFLHASWAHLIANTVPLAVLGWIVMLRRKRDFFYVSAISGFIGGLGTWLFGNLIGHGADAVHVGASGVIFGLLGYLLSRGIFERKLWSILGGVAALLLYGGALWGVLPGQTGISWEGHLFGLIGGIFAARFLTSSAPKEQAPAKLPAAKRRIAAVGGDDDDGGRRLAAKRELDAEHEADIEAELEALRRRKLTR